MTRGRPLPLMLRFMWPVALMLVCNLLYTMADSIIVGRLLGVEAFAAVGSGGNFYIRIYIMLIGFCQGFSVLVGQRFGAGEHKALRSAVSGSLLLAALIGAFFSAFLLPLVEPVLRLLQTPSDIIGGAAIYLYWMFGGIVITMLSYMAASVLRSLGDSRLPMIASVCSAFLNIGLDLLFVGGLGFGISGAAAATLLSSLAVLLCCVFRIRAISVLRGLNKAKPDGESVITLLKLGVPPSARGFVIAAGGMVFQWVVNGYGTDFVAGMAAASRYIDFMDIVGASLDCTAAVFVAQNFGAGQFSRIKKGMRTLRLMSYAGAAASAALLIALRRQLIALFVTGGEHEVIEVGAGALFAMAVCIPALYLLFICRSGMQSLGKTLIPTLSGFVELAGRLFAVFVLTRFIGEVGVYCAFGLGWVAAALLLVTGYFAAYKSESRKRLSRDGGE